ncbi:ribonuclease E/G [Falsiroseomonas tokyonensis]|uniref:Ribonuclease E/G n=1 Tax=Falsiroseomonas tokyonensis TaxID=430521 RepID=A0ABV7BRY4_9PROT|nr:ribonuclease E/G [Falsiroseomonas tokyonensis]MBU8538305.1 ribonuclease E/G [Falsiroseomonas tokyonensis]
MSGDAEIRVSVSPGEVRVAGLRDGRLEVAFIERPSRPDGVGDLHRARVTAILPAMSGAFLLLGDDTSGFLPESELPPPRRPIAKALQEGQSLPVRVMRAAQGGKGPRLSARLSPAEQKLAQQVGSGAPALLQRGDGAAMRLARDWPEAPIVTDGPAVAGLLRAALDPARITLTLSPAFGPELEARFAELAEPRLALDGGASLIFHPTPALTAIDVDSGSLAASRDPVAHERLNAVAIPAIARELRLRNLAGAILVDFAGLAVRRREMLVAPLAEALAQDPLSPRLLGMTRLGLMEIVRPRVHPPLHEILGLPPSPLTCGLAALRQAVREEAAKPGASFALRAAPEVILALQALPQSLMDYQAITQRALALQPDPRLRPGQEDIMEIPG